MNTLLAVAQRKDAGEITLDVALGRAEESLLIGSGMSVKPASIDARRASLAGRYRPLSGLIQSPP